MKIAHWSAAAGLAMLCAAGSASAQISAPSNGKEVVQPTGATGATAYQPAGAGRAEAQANTGDQHGSAGMQKPVTPGFDNKPPKGAKVGCQRPQGGVDASGGENLTTTGKHNTHCTDDKGDNKGNDKGGKARR